MNRVFKITNALRIAVIFRNRYQFGFGFYSRRGSGWRTRHVFFGLCRNPIYFIGW